MWINLVREIMANSLTDSDFTSIQQRLHDYAKYKSSRSPSEKSWGKRIEQQKSIQQAYDLDKVSAAPFMPFDGSSRTPIHHALLFTREDYFELIDQTGRSIRNDKCWFIPSQESPILAQLGMDSAKWIDHIQYFRRHLLFR